MHHCMALPGIADIAALRCCGVAPRTTRPPPSGFLTRRHASHKGVMIYHVELVEKRAKVAAAWLLRFQPLADHEHVVYCCLLESCCCILLILFGKYCILLDLVHSCVFFLIFEVQYSLEQTIVLLRAAQILRGSNCHRRKFRIRTSDNMDR